MPVHPKKWFDIITLLLKNKTLLLKNKSLAGCKSYGHLRTLVSQVRILFLVKFQWEFSQCSIKFSTTKVRLNRIKMKQTHDKKKNFMAPFYGWGSTASRLVSYTVHLIVPCTLSYTLFLEHFNTIVEKYGSKNYCSHF